MNLSERSLKTKDLAFHHSVYIGILQGGSISRWIEKSMARIAIRFAMTYETLPSIPPPLQGQQPSQHSTISVTEHGILDIGLWTPTALCWELTHCTWTLLEANCLPVEIDFSNFAPNIQSGLKMKEVLRKHTISTATFVDFTLCYSPSDRQAKGGILDSSTRIWEEWARSKKLTSVQFLSVLWHAIEDHEL